MRATHQGSVVEKPICFSGNNAVAYIRLGGEVSDDVNIRAEYNSAWLTRDEFLDLKTKINSFRLPDIPSVIKLTTEVVQRKQMVHRGTMSGQFYSKRNAESGYFTTHPVEVTINQTIRRDTRGKFAKV